ncbi:MAG: diguanylate cyclase domain-containing protein [Burkholderiales bacterium]
MGEADLSDIENRIEQYPPQARHDILRLTQELRRLYERERQKSHAQATSPLYDALTGLLNAGAYGVRFAMARARATRFRKIFAVMSVDLAFANGPGGETLSAADHDAAIKDAGRRLEARVRATDTLARIGEDNFAIIVEDLSQPGHAERVKKNVQEAFADPLHAGERSIPARATVSMEFYPQQAPGSFAYN